MAEEVSMRVFLAACLAAVVIAVGAALVLNTLIGGSSQRAFSSPAVRL
jgi:hypothetical protein